MAHPNVVFMGVCGCGKSTVARCYADVTDRVLIEADDFRRGSDVHGQAMLRGSLRGLQGRQLTIQEAGRHEMPLAGT